MLFRNFWILGVIVGLINSYIIRSRILSIVRQNPELKQEGEQLTKGYFFALTLPWLILGVLQLAGGFSDFSYMFSRDLNNIYVLLSRGFIIFCLLLYLYWMVFRNGARSLIKFKLIRGLFSENERGLKFVALVGTTASIISFVMMN